MKRNGAFFIYCYPFRGGPKVGLKLPTVTLKSEAQQIEALIVRACRTGDYSGLDSVAREGCIRMFTNQGWELPPDLGGAVPGMPAEELTLKRASQLFLKSPEIRDSPGRARHETALLNILPLVGEGRPLKGLWIQDLKAYRVARLNDGAAAGTVNREMATLSAIFRTMVEMQLIESNPARLVKRLSTKAGERQVYLAMDLVARIVAKCPAWNQPIVWTACYTGMRRGEILDLTRKQVSLSKRMIYLGPENTKEGHWKRVPIHNDLVTILEEAMKTPLLGSDNVFFLRDEKGVRPLGLETFKNPWERSCKALEMEDPLPRFHDLRHTWKTNARRSGMDPEIREAILGHSSRQRSVSERYGFLGDEEFLAAIDGMTFDHGETVILVASPAKPKKQEARSKGSRKNGNWIVTERHEKKKGHGAS